MKLLKVLLLVSLVSMVTASMQFTSPDQLSSCPCDPVTYRLKVNTNQAESFALQVQPQSQYLSYYVQPIAQSANTAEFEVVFTSSCSTPQGDYSFNVKAQGSQGSVFEEQGSLRVKQCTSVGVSAPAVQNVCPGEETKYLITVSNKGLFNENGVLTVDLNPSLFTLSGNTFSLAPTNSKQFTMLVNVPKGFPATEIPFKVTADSDYSYQEAYSILKIGGEQCTNLKIELPPVIEAQPDFLTTRDVKFTNLGLQDSFDVSLACPQFTSLNLNKISLTTGQSTTGLLSIRPSKSDVGKDFDCVVNAKSVKYGNTFSAKTKIVVRDFYIAELNAKVNGNQVAACEADPVSIEFEINNKGRQTTYDVSVSGLPAFSDASSITVGENSKKSFKVSTIAQNGAVTVTVRSQYQTLSKTIAVAAKDCFDSSLTTNKNVIEVCPLAKDSVTVTLRNSGEKTDSYSFGTIGSKASVSLSKTSTQLSPGASDSVIVIVAPTEQQYGSTETITFTAKGLKESRTSQITLKVPSKETCFNLGLTVEQVPDTHRISVQPMSTQIACAQCSTASLGLTLLNKGDFDESITLESDTPWALLKPEELTLRKGESKEVFLYLAPTAQIAPGDYQINLMIGNQKTNVKLSLKAKILPYGSNASRIDVVVSEVEENFTEGNTTQSQLSKLSGLFVANASWFALVLILIAGVGVAYYFLKKSKETGEVPIQEVQPDVKEEVKQAVEEVKEKPIKKKKKTKK
ncbi:hypothetical protein HUU53_02930 [Candidatus Micrarchaeota archaeon]|nr:hypothetical protein [Candidatus Micrarchaeota archaeon]